MSEVLSFGVWLKQRRRSLDLTQAEMADRAACSLSTLRKIEAGDLLPSKVLARLLAVALAVPADEQEAFIAFARDERRANLTPAFVTATSVPVAPLPVSASAPVTIPLPATTTLSKARRGALPVQLTALIGRTDEVREVQQLLAAPTCRLLTLVGPGGIGKTCLALAVAQALTEPDAPENLKFNEGVYFASFVGVTAPDFILSTIAGALNFTFAGMGDPKTQLLNYLSEKAILLILDNLEHLLNGTPLLSELLQAAPAVKVMATSRERLDLQGEWVFDLPTLATPAQPHPDAAVPLEELVTYAAVTLFVERAQRTHHGFALSAQNRAAVAQICRLVDGMPLALELAAGWVYTLSCAEIADEIARNLDFLAANNRNLPERQRSVRASFDHSWRLLSTAEQQALRRLAVFRGGFQRETAASVAAAPLPLLAGLVSKSLVRRTVDGRYELHELVRQYAADHLRRDPDEEMTTQDTHATYFLRLLADREAWLCSHRHQDGRAELIREHENLRVAWAWAAQRRQFNLLRRATFSFWFFHELRCLLHEGEGLFQRAVQSIETEQITEATGKSEEQIVYGHLLANQAWFAFRIGRIASARLMLQQAIVLLRTQEDQRALVDALWYLCVLGWFEGSLQEAEQLAREAIDLSRRLGLEWQESMCLSSLGYITHFQGNYHQAQGFFEEALALMRTLGDPRTTAIHIAGLCWNNQVLGRFAESKPLLCEALQFAIDLDDANTLGPTLQSMALIAFAEKNMDEAEQIIQGALVNFRKQGDTWHITNALNLLGWIYIHKEQPIAARRNFSESVTIAMRSQLTLNALDALVGLTDAQAKIAPLLLHLTVVQHVLLNPAGTQKTRDRADELRMTLEATFEPHQIEAAHTLAQEITLESLVAAMTGHY